MRYIDPSTMTSREFQVEVIRRTYEEPARGVFAQTERNQILAYAVPELLDYIDELREENTRLRAELAALKKD